MRGSLYTSLVAACTLFAMADLALAGLSVPAPAPIAGAGIPGLLLAAGTMWLVRRVRARSKENQQD